MKVTWLIEKDVFPEGDVSKRMIEIARELGVEAKSYRYIGFDGGTEPKDLPRKEACIISYGSINAAKFIQKRCKWIPGVWCDFNTLRCRTYLSYWGKFSIQKKYLFLPLSEVYRQRDWLYETLGQSKGYFHDHIFVRPDDNAKSFHGEVISRPKFEEWYEVANIYNPGEECLCLVSEPTYIDGEWRFIIADRKVITGSQVRDDNKLAIAPGFPKEAAELAEKIANSCEFNPHPIYVMDICCHAGEYYLMEIGSMNCAGLYACDLKAIVEKASEIAWREWQDLQIEERENVDES